MDDPGWIVRGNGDGGVGHSRCTGSAGGSDAMAGGRIERPRLSGGRRRPADGHLWGTRARHPRLEGLAARYALLNADLYTRRTIEGSSPVVKPIEAVGIGREPRGRGETVSRGRLRGRTERHDTAGAWRRRCRFCRYPTRCRRGIRRCGYSPYDRLRTDAAIACPCRVADSQLMGQGITSFAQVEHGAWTPVQALFRRAPPDGARR